MTKFERDYNEIMNDAFAATPILMERKAELEKLENEGKRCKNGFRRQCIAQEYTKKLSEYKALDELI